MVKANSVKDGKFQQYCAVQLKLFIFLAAFTFPFVQHAPAAHLSTVQLYLSRTRNGFSFSFANLLAVLAIIYELLPSSQFI